MTNYPHNDNCTRSGSIESTDDPVYWEAGTYRDDMYCTECEAKATEVFASEGYEVPNSMKSDKTAVVRISGIEAQSKGTSANNLTADLEAELYTLLMDHQPAGIKPEGGVKATIEDSDGNTIGEGF